MELEEEAKQEQVILHLPARNNGFEQRLEGLSSWPQTLQSLICCHVLKASSRGLEP